MIENIWRVNCRCLCVRTLVFCIAGHRWARQRCGCRLSDWPRAPAEIRPDTCTLTGSVAAAALQSRAPSLLCGNKHGDVDCICMQNTKAYMVYAALCVRFNGLLPIGNSSGQDFKAGQTSTKHAAAWKCMKSIVIWILCHGLDQYGIADNLNDTRRYSTATYSKT